MPKGTLALFLTCVCWGAACRRSPRPPPLKAVADSSRAKPRICAVTLDARKQPDAALLPRLKRLGVTHVTLVSFGVQPGVAVPEVHMHTGSGWYSESDSGIQQIARQADTLGLRVILKPHLWVGAYSANGQARHRIAFSSERNWEKWERQYHRFLMHYARLAEKVGASILVVGTELRSTVRERPDFWRRLIRDVRTVYGGKLTYAANWHGEYEQVPFWKALDYVGVQAYFPVSSADQPSLEQIERGWREHRRALQRVHQRSERPVLFTELGYRSAPSAARRPWQWPTKKDTTIALSLQARLYRAFFASTWRAPWLAGAILWKWHSNPARVASHGFSPQGKPAEAAIRQGFSSSR